MFTGPEIVDCLKQMGITHLVWLPDSTLGDWESSLRQAEGLRVIGVCREGEAWAMAAGLYLGGAQPLVMIQCTGLFESGDALRNVIHDFRMPLYALIGYRSYLSQASLPGDTAQIFTEPILQAWKLDYRLIDHPDKRSLIVEHYKECRAARRAGVALLAEGKA